MDKGHVGLCEHGDAPVALIPMIRPLSPAGDTNTPAIVALAELMECCGVIGALQISANIAAHFSSVTALLTATSEEILVRTGTRPELARLVAAFGRLHHATLRDEIVRQQALGSYDDLKEFALQRLRGCEIEEVLALLLDRKNFVLREYPIRGGTVDHVQLYPREVVRLALLYNASAVILVHNHPSGDPTPSQADIEMSRAVSTALAAVGIAFHEHLIVGANKVAGIRAMGLL